MNRMTKLDIQRALLAGREVAWTGASGKREALILDKPAQRRLLAFLLQSTVRDPKGLTDAFVSGLSKAHGEETDPATDTVAASAVAAGGPWRLQQIETEGFGGLNTCGGPVFSLEVEGESWLLEGPNGSGKSSLIGAVLWAMTGERPREHSAAKPEDSAEVYGVDDRKLGAWPPIACYPDTAEGLTTRPHVRVTLTFADPSGATATVERELKDGTVKARVAAALNLPEVLIETGLLMPSRMPLIRFDKGQTPLTRAVQSLTGLDDLLDLGALVDGLCHKGREYLSTHAKTLAQQKGSFEEALGEAERALKRAGEAAPSFEPKDTANDEGVFAAFGKRLRARAAELTQVVREDLVEGLDLANPVVQQQVAGAISGAREDLGGGLQAMATWTSLSANAAALDGPVAGRLTAAADAADAALAEALGLDECAQNDTRFS